MTSNKTKSAVLIGVPLSIAAGYFLYKYYNSQKKTATKNKEDKEENQKNVDYETKEIKSGFTDTSGETENESMDSLEEADIELLHEGRNELGKITRPNVRFSDIVGHESVKADLQDIVNQIYNPHIVAKRKGLILYGPPGVAKTMLVQALSCESKCAIISLSAAYLLQNGRSKASAKLRKAFLKARENAPCVIFIDEIDRVAKELTAELLSQLDGYDSTLNSNVIAIAATNNITDLCDALTRKGRFDYVIRLDLPNRQERELLLEKYAPGDPIDYKVYAELTEGMSGADIRALSNEAQILASRVKRTYNEMDFEKAFLRHHLGCPRNVHREPQEEQRIAIHEASHLVVGLALKCRVLMATILPHQSAEGVVWHLPKNQFDNVETEEDMFKKIVIRLAGYVGERMEYGQHSTGVENDLDQARALSCEMVHLGMGDSKIFYVVEDERLFEKKWIRDKIEVLLEKANVKAEEICSKNHYKIRKFAEALMHHNILRSDFIYKYDLQLNEPIEKV